jgi:hypothetical protein
MQDIFAAELPPEEEVGPATRLLAPLAWTGLRPQFTHKMAAHGVTLPADVFEVDQREVARISRRRRA